MAKNTLNKLKTTELVNWVREKPTEYKGDGGGLWCRYNDFGKNWIYRFTMPGDKKEQNMGLGTFPEVSLADARQLRDIYNAQKKQGINPLVERESIKKRNVEQYDERFVFATLFQNLIKEKKDTWSDGNRLRYEGIYRNYLEKDLAKKSILRLTDHELLTTLKKIKTNPVALRSGKIDLKKYPRASTVNLAKSLINLVYTYALEWEQFGGENPLKKHEKHSLWKKPKVKGHKGVREEDLGSFVYQIKRLPILQDRIYLMVDLLTALRVGCLARVTWSMFNPTKKNITIPVELLKTDFDIEEEDDFIAPLPDEVVDEIVELKKMLDAKKDDYIFTNRNGDHYDPNRPRLLIKEKMGFSYATAHGNRKVLKLNASRYSNISHYAVEYQLTHERSTKNSTEDTYLDGYNWLEERIKLVNWMYDYLNQMEANYMAIQKIGRTNVRTSV